MGKKGKSKQPQGRAKKRQQKPSYSGGQYAYMPDDSDDEPQKQFKGFSQGTPKGGFQQQRGPTVKLRHQTISFVSAGNSTPMEPEIREAEQRGEAVMAQAEMSGEEDDYLREQEDSSVDDSGIQTNIVTDAEAEISEGAMGRMNINSPPSPQDLFIVDTVGDPSLAPKPSVNGKGKKAAPRAPSPARSDTSEEVVLFHGRNGPHGPSARAKPAPSKRTESPAQSARSAQTMETTSTQIITHTEAPPARSAPHVTDDLLAALGASPEPSASLPSPAKGWASKVSKQDREAAGSADQPWQAASSTPYWRKGKPRPDLNPQYGSDSMIEGSPSRTSKVMFTEPEDSKGAAENVRPRTAARTITDGMPPASSSRVNGASSTKANGQGANETIAALRADWKSALREKKTATNEPRAQPQSKRRGKRGRKQSNRQLRGPIDDSDDDNDDDEAAYDDYMANLVAQINNESSPEEAAALTSILAAAGSGPSLVVDGKKVGEGELLKHDTEQDWEDETDSDDSDNELIGQDASEVDNEDGPLNISDLDSSELEDELEYTEREQWEDEEDLHQRRQDAMTDEHLARLFAKQQELGIDGDEIVIDDGIFDAMDGVGDLDAARTGLHQITNSPFAVRSRPSKKRRSGRGNGDFSFPDASALADTVEQYGEDGFDIMDFDRPSLRNTKKGRKGKIAPELEALSDDELREEMLGAWENDRAKKRFKKAEREELRAQGMLGGSARKHGKADLSQKYLQGMTMTQVHGELAVFLQDDGLQSRSFPPMAKKERATLHEIAGALGLKSLSKGSGHSRFPVLYKTRFTLEYSDFMLQRVMKHADNPRFLKNARAKGRKGKGAGPGTGAGRARGGGFDKASTGLRDGQVVGGSAPELGSNNFGHKLMQKMGWQAGTALGKDGEGLLVPVAQVMRSGKAGLG